MLMRNLSLQEASGACAGQQDPPRRPGVVPQRLEISSLDKIPSDGLAECGFFSYRESAPTSP